MKLILVDDQGNILDNEVVDRIEEYDLSKSFACSSVCLAIQQAIERIRKYPNSS